MEEEEEEEEEEEVEEAMDAGWWLTAITRSLESIQKRPIFEEKGQICSQFNSHRGFLQK